MIRILWNITLNRHIDDKECADKETTNVTHALIKYDINCFID